MATVDQMERLKFLLSVYQQPGDPAQKPEIRRRIAQALTLLWGDPRFDQAQALTRKAGLQPVIGQDGVMTVQPTVIQNPNTKKAAPGAPIGGVGMTGSAPVAKTVERGEGGFNRGNPAAATSVSTSSPFGPGNPRGAGQGQLDAGSVAPGLGPAGTGGPGGDLASGLGSVGGDNQNWDTALLDQQLGSIPSGSYLSGSTGGTVAGMLPSIDPTSQQNAAAAGFMTLHPPRSTWAVNLTATRRSFLSVWRSARGGFARRGNAWPRTRMPFRSARPSRPWSSR